MRLKLVYLENFNPGKGGDDDVGETQPSSSPPVNVREFCLVIFSHATTLPSYLLLPLNEHDDEGEDEGGQGG